MTSQKHRFVVLETSNGNTIWTERLSDGTMSWQVNPGDLKKRKQSAAIVSSSSCQEKDIRLKEVFRLHRALASSADSLLSPEQYADSIYSVASGSAVQEPGDAEKEVLPAALYDGSAGKTLEMELSSFASFEASKVQVQPVEPVDSQLGRYGGRCVVVRNVLTPDECRRLIHVMSPGMEGVSYRQDYRRNDRNLWYSAELADLLWSRVRHIAAPWAVCVEQDPARQHLLSEAASECECPGELRVGYGKEGIWHPEGLNPLWRFCKYSPGDFFRKHCDGSYVRSDDERSLFTCMFYLNDDFQGGATRFLHYSVEDGCRGDPYELARDEEVLASVAPEAGSCIMFFQPGLLHEGEDLFEGEKYILRSDVMCRRDASSRPQRTAQQEEAYQLLKRAEQAECSGECDRAWRLYRRAYKLDPRLERMY